MLNTGKMRAALVLGLLICVSFSVAITKTAYAAAQVPQQCTLYNPLRTAFFGDTHVHTKYSLDASTQDTRTTPAQAYQFARGARIGIQPWTAQGEALRSMQLSRPLDFTAVTDHAELLGEVSICNTPGMEGYGSWACKLYRGWPRAAYYLFNYMSSVEASHLGFCGDNGQLCKSAALGPWRETQQAAEEAYDRSDACSFTSFVAYEWTGVTPVSGNLHRNVIFRNEQVPEFPFSWIDGPSKEALWEALDRQCINAEGDCDVLTIPHNSNLSGGLMFTLAGPDGKLETAEQARWRARMELLAEVTQHKGTSECFFGAGTRDELCAFEQLPYQTFKGQNSRYLLTPPDANVGFLREVMLQGLQEQQRIAANPFKWGWVGSTDTHLGAPGAVSEQGFLGHGGAGVPAKDNIPPGLPDDLEFNPGGLAVLYAEENTRDSLFDAMRRKEAYATSGPRIGVRFFAGWDYPENLCEQTDMLARAYSGGVPMGGDLPSADANAVPRFVVHASKDVGTQSFPGTDLQRVQIIKGWVDQAGEAHTEIFDVAGDANNGASVDLSSCQRQGRGASSLCSVWQDPDFNASDNAYYYARVVENPSCRWSQYICSINKVDCANPQTITEGLENCCSAEHRPIIQERAWTSPIWYTAPR